MRMDDLVRRARAGHDGSREALARQWLAPAYGVALAVTGRAQDAEEVVQEAFYRAFRSLRTLRNPKRFGPWLIQIVRNAARDRHRLRESARSVSDADRAVSDPDVVDEEVVTAWRRLPDDERLVVWLKVVDGMTIRALADLLGTSKSAVDRTFRRGLGRLRKEVSHADL